jgi:hypothetical protein
MIHIFNTKEAFYHFLGVRAKGFTLKYGFDANSHTYYHYYIDRESTRHIIGHSSIPFSSSRLGLIFGHDINLENLRMGYPGIASVIEKYLLSKEKWKLG